MVFGIVHLKAGGDRGPGGEDVVEVEVVIPIPLGACPKEGTEIGPQKSPLLAVTA